MVESFWYESCATGSLTFRRNLLLVICLAIPLGITPMLAGCGAESVRNFDEKLATIGDQPPSLPSAAEYRTEPGETTLTSQKTDASSDQPPQVRRRIVYTTTLGMVVEKYSTFEKSFQALVQSNNGFIAKSETKRNYEDRQTGLWVARIPVQQYSSFLREVVDLGFAESRTEDANDVTSEFVDIEARIRNNQELERRIITMLEERTGKLSDVIEIERELSRVREEVERMQGRLRVLADQSELATITVRVREEIEYVPPQAPTLPTRLASTWASSVGALGRTGEGILLAAVAVLPWFVSVLVIAALFGFPVWWWRRSAHPSSAS